MKIAVKLDRRKQGETNLGFPVVVYCSQNYKKKTIRTGYYAKITQWNDKLAEPKKSHPDFYLLSDYLDNLKLRIKKLVRKSIDEVVSFDDVASFLFKKEYTTFFETAENYINNPLSTKQSAINSFNTFFPGVSVTEVNKDMVQKYIGFLLAKGNKAGGVDSYMRSLRAIFNVIGSEYPNPFSKYKIEIPDKINVVASAEDLKILQNAQLENSGPIGGPFNFRNYWLLMFYLGGIDPEVLSKLRYDKNEVNGRIQFNRDKGRSKVACNNVIPPQAYEILNLYDCKPYFVPIYQSKDYKNFMSNFNRRFKVLCVKLNLSAELRPKTPRYTFINRAQQLLVDERVTAQIVGHKRKSTTSLYTNDFPLEVQDEAHLKIISISAEITD